MTSFILFRSALLLGQVPGLQHSGDDKLSIEEYEKLVRKAMPGTVK